MNLALPSGGCVATLYGLIVAGIGSTAVAASLAELCSVYPTNGAQYEWTAALAPPKYERYLSYICGWVVTASWWALSAAGPSLVASLAIGLISLYAENYEFQRWHQFLIFLGVEVVAAVTNALGTALLPWIGKASCEWSLGIRRHEAMSVLIPIESHAFPLRTRCNLNHCSSLQRWPLSECRVRML